MESTINNLLEFFFILTGFLLIYTAGSVFVDKTHPTRLGTTVFWLLLGVIFAIGNFIPYTLSGIMLLVIGVLTLLKQVKLGHVRPVEEAEAEKASDRIGNWVFLPVVVLAAVAVGVAQFTELGGQVGIGIGAVVSLMTGILVTRATPKTVMDDSNRMIQQVGTTGILPQLLAALGVIFTAAGVGEVIAGGISTVLPEGNRFLGVVAYCLGMVIFTMIMGNAFAAFTVITAGIGVPFVIAQGGDPVIAGAIAMTVGFCGTLLTPMAANFNALPAALLEMKSETGVIKEQTPLALVMIVVHIALMYFWAF